MPWYKLSVHKWYQDRHSRCHPVSIVAIFAYGGNPNIFITLLPPQYNASWPAAHRQGRRSRTVEASVINDKECYLELGGLSPWGGGGGGSRLRYYNLSLWCHLLPAMHDYYKFTMHATNCDIAFHWQHQGIIIQHSKLYLESGWANLQCIGSGDHYVMTKISIGIHVYMWPYLGKGDILCKNWNFN